MNLLANLQGHDSARAQILAALGSGRWPSGTLISGPRGVGKAMLARTVAQALLCPERSRDSQACGLCSSCTRIEKHEALMWVALEEDRAQITVEQVRAIREFVSLKAWSAQGRVVVIEEAQAMNPQASNLLLKTLEEPPEGTHLLLTSSQPVLLLPTVRSRLQKLNLGPLPRESLCKLRPHAPEWVLRASRGSLKTVDDLIGGGADSLRDTAWSSFCLLAQGDLDFERREDLRGLFKSRANALWLLQFWLQFVRDLRVASSGQPSEVWHQDLWERERSFSLSAEDLDQIYVRVQQALDDINANVDRGLVVDHTAVWRTTHVD